MACFTAVIPKAAIALLLACSPGCEADGGRAAAVAAEQAARRGYAQNARRDEARACRAAAEGLDLQLQAARELAASLPGRQEALDRAEKVPGVVPATVDLVRRRVADAQHATADVRRLEVELARKRQECERLAGLAASPR